MQRLCFFILPLLAKLVPHFDAGERVGVKSWFREGGVRTCLHKIHHAIHSVWRGEPEFCL